MNDQSSTGPGGTLSRRQMLAAVAGGAAGLGVTALTGCSGTPERSRATGGSATVPTAGAPAARRLVIIELPGGNDGLSMLVPVNDGRYHDLRPTTKLRDDELIDFGGNMAINATLAGLHAEGLAMLAGVGAQHASLSHFEMIARWWAGTPNTTEPSGSGFLGRLCDHLGPAGTLTGVSIAPLASPALRGSPNNTTGPADGRPLAPIMGGGPGVQVAYRQALADMGATAPPTTISAGSRASLTQMLAADDIIGSLPPVAGDYPVGSPAAERFGSQMAFAGQLVRADSSVKVIHVPAQGLLFDTHENHRVDHARSLAAVVPALERFRVELADAGLTDDVLIATTSEFGRRLREAGGGLDHGSASTVMLMGPVKPGVHGEASSLRKLDRDGNLAATTQFSEYYATLAAWMGVDPELVLDGRPQPIEALVRG